MSTAPQYATIGTLLTIALLSGPSCDEQVDETVTPVQISPSDESQAPVAPAIEQLRVRVVAKYPHARDAFTQGLLWHDGAMYESTGRYGRSSLRRVRLEDGEVLAERSLDPSFFGEGLALVDDRLVQLTWRSGVAVVSDLESLEPQEMLRYPGEGWGLCFDGAELVMSDGSSILELRDPDTMALLREMTVWRGERPVRNLNELECVGDDIYANVWQSNEIMRIDAKTGRVTAVIDASGLLTAIESLRSDVLNGIAYKPDTDTFLLTGKLWPHVFEVELVAR
ncbi:MAG: glutaminyl-peptide cyclotransferase [Polyangiales bacterium]|jgi:glutamine cyclotransferase